MKKATIIFLLIAFILFALEPRLVFSQIMTVPVFDDNAGRGLANIIDTLNSLLSLTSEGFQNLNIALSGVLETRFEEAANRLVSDFLKETEYQQYASDLLKFVQLREELTRTSAEEFLDEAKMAGAYEGLIKLPENIPCINPNLRLEFTGYVLELMQDFKLTTKAQEILDQIPDCDVPETTAISFKPNFFAWLTEPFKLNLAQVSPPAVEEEFPPTVITPAFQQTEEAIELDDLRSLASNLVLTKVKESATEMQEKLNGPLPIMDCLAENTEFDGGQAVCLKYRVLISGDEIKNLKQNIVLNNPLYQTTQDVNTYQKFVETPNIIKKLGLAISPVTTSSELVYTDLLSTSTIKEIADRSCGSFAINQANNNPTSAYALCLKQFTIKLQQYAEITKKEIEQRIEQATDTKAAIDSAIEKAEDLKNSLTNCPAAYEDLANLTQELLGRSGLYDYILDQLKPLKSAIDGLVSQINNLLSQIDNIFNNIFNTATDVLDILDKLFNLLITATKNTGIFLPIIQAIYDSKQVIDKLKGIKNQVLNEIKGIISSFNNYLNQFANVIYEFNQLNYNFYQSDFSRSDILNDAYQLQLILQKLDAYERLAQRGGCSTSPPPGISLLNKNQVIVVESKKPEIKSINFLALVKKLFQPKLVEIRNEK